MAAKDQAVRLRELLTSLEGALVAAEREFFAERKLCASDLAILRRLSKKGERPVNSLAEKVELSSGSMTTAIQRLIKNGWVTKRSDHLDRRLVMVNITEAGRKVASEAHEVRSEMLAPLLGGVNAKDEKFLTASLKSLRKAARSMKK